MRPGSWFDPEWLSARGAGPWGARSGTARSPRPGRRRPRSRGAPCPVRPTPSAWRLGRESCAGKPQAWPAGPRNTLRRSPLSRVRAAMLLAVDVGNTNVTLALFDGERLAADWRLTSRREWTADDLAYQLRQLFEYHVFIYN